MAGPVTNQGTLRIKNPNVGTSLFDSAQRTETEQLFEKVKAVQLLSLREPLSNSNETRRQIDLFFTKILDPAMDANETKEFLNNLYAWILARLDQMLRAMT
jgi:hypothetical protein